VPPVEYLLSSSVAAVSITTGGCRWLTAAKAQRRSRCCCDLPGTLCVQELESRPLPDHTLVRRLTAFPLKHVPFAARR
jgi:hypothetical protein